MTLVRAASGTYEGDFRRKGMRRLHLSLRTEKRREAQRLHDAVQHIVRRGLLPLVEQLRTGALTVDRLAEMVDRGEPLVPVPEPVPAPTWGTVRAEADRYLAWLRAHPRKSAGTIATVAPQLSRFCAFAIEGTPMGDRPLEAVTSAMIEAYQRAFLDAGTPPNTITAYMGRVRALWRWAETQEHRRAKEERRQPHPLYSPVDPEMLVRESTRRERALTEEEAERLLAATPEPLLFAVAAGLFAGLRLGETLHLRPALDVDLELGTLAVQRQPDWRPKTKRSVRVVPIAEPLRPILEHHLTRWAADAWVTPRITDPALPFLERTFQIEFTTIVRRAGLVAGRRDPRGVTYHTLRHTFASWLVRRGVDLYTVAKLLGDTLQVVESTYAHLSPDVQRAAVAKLAGLIKLPELPQEMTQEGA